MASTRTFKFIEAPPERYMRRRSPESAPRLFEWLVSNGYVEPVTTYSNRKGGNSGMLANGRAGKAKKKKQPVF